MSDVKELVAFEKKLVATYSYDGTVDEWLLGVIENEGGGGLSLGTLENLGKHQKFDPKAIKGGLDRLKRRKKVVEGKESKTHKLGPRYKLAKVR